MINGSRRTRPLWLLAVIGTAILAAPAFADETHEQSCDEKVEKALAATARCPGLVRSAIGVTRAGTSIPCLISNEDLNVRGSKTRILLVSGLDGSDRAVQVTLSALRWFYTSDDAQPWRSRFAVSAVPIGNPDGWASGKTGTNLAGGDPSRGYPPRGTAYDSPTDPEAAYLWRWIGMHAPDLVVDVRSGMPPLWQVPPEVKQRFPRLAEKLHPVVQLAESDELISQLVRAAPANVGTIPSLHVLTSTDQFLKHLFEAIAASDFSGPSACRQELQRRVSRSPVEAATLLAKHYGHELKTVEYIPALALVGRLRLGELTDDRTHAADVERIVEPYFSGSRPTLPAQVSGSTLSGHLVFGELARSTGKPRYTELVSAAADLGFDGNGAPKVAMPFHNEMSDAVFMGCPILVQAGRLTGEARYDGMALRHMRFMLKLNLRADGLHRHSPLDETAWGRGNGFPALGLALCLSELPQDHAGRDEMLQTFRSHLRALRQHQDPTGAWHQVIDHPGSYREFTATCMITFSMLRGVRLGWLEEAEFAPHIEKAWPAILARIASDGTLVDVCTGTGKQKSLRDYLDRPAILGHDARGGAMALLVATEMAEWHRK